MQMCGKAFMSSAWHQCSLSTLSLVNRATFKTHLYYCSADGLLLLHAWHGAETVVCLLEDWPALQSPEKQYIINIKFCAANRVEQKEPFSQWESF